MTNRGMMIVSLTVVVVIKYAAMRTLGRKRFKIAQLTCAMKACAPLRYGLTNCKNRPMPTIAARFTMMLQNALI